MPPEIDRQLSSGLLTIGQDERLENARRVLANLAAYDWAPTSEWVQKPSELGPVFDDELIAAHQSKERGEKIMKEREAQLKVLGTWKVAVRAVESRMASNLQLLAATVNIFETAQWEPEAEQVRMFIGQRYSCRLPVPCPDAFTGWIRIWADRFSQNRELLPLNLRRMVRTRKPRAVDEPSTQAELGYDAGE